MSDTNRGLYDAALESEFSLPSTTGSGAAVTSGALPVKNAADAITPQGVELEAYLPALSAAQLPGGSINAVVQHSKDGGNNWDSLYGTVASASGGTAGSAAVTKLIGLPSDCGDLVRLSVSTATGAGNCSASKAYLRLKF